MPKIGDNLEGEEADADGHHDVRHGNRNAEQRVDVFHEEAGVFEHRQHTEVEHQRGGDDGLAVRAMIFNQQSGDIVDQRRQQQQKNVKRLAPRVEKERGGDEHRVLPRDVFEQEVENQRCAQENVYKEQIGKDHQGSSQQILSALGTPLDRIYHSTHSVNW